MRSCFARHLYKLVPVFGVFALFGQSAGTPATSASVPEHVRYRFVFERLYQQELFGDHLDAGHHDSSNVRSKIRKGAQLTQAEDMALKSIAKDFHAAKMKYFSDRDKLYKDMRARVGPGAIDPMIMTQIWELGKQYNAMSIAHLDQLKSAFGTARFHVFDEYVRSTMLRSAGVAGFNEKK